MNDFEEVAEVQKSGDCHVCPGERLGQWLSFGCRPCRPESWYTKIRAAILRRLRFLMGCFLLKMENVLPVFLL